MARGGREAVARRARTTAGEGTGLGESALGAAPDHEKDVNAAIKQILSEMELAARTPPVEACHPYQCDARRKLVIRTIWALFKRVRGGRADAE